MIASLPRTGSTFLGLELWRSGVCGAPLEYFNLRGGWASPGGDLNALSGRAYLGKLQQRRTSPNGVFGFKMFLNDYRDLLDLKPDLFSIIQSTNTIYLTRLDRLAQAVSYARAAQTGRWSHDVRETITPDYKRTDILKALFWIRQQETQWERIFLVTGCRPVRVYYEEIVACPDATNRVLDALGIPGDKGAAVQLPEMVIQADETSARWKAAFLQGV